MNQINAIVINQSNGYYQFKQVETERVFSVPYKSVHYCQFPQIMYDDHGLLKQGCLIRMMEKKLSEEKSLFYPAHECYPPKAAPSNSSSVDVPVLTHDSVKVITINSEDELHSLRTEFCERIGQFDLPTRQEALTVLSNCDVKKTCHYLRKILNRPLFSPENGSVEYKSSFIHAAESRYANDYKFQLHELVKVLISFANSDNHRGTLYVGITDNQQVCGVENEFQEFNPEFNREKFTGMFINLIKQTASNSLWLQTQFEWLEIDGHLCARMSVNYQGDVVLYNSTELYIRKESGTFRLTGQDLIDYIRNRANTTI